MYYICNLSSIIILCRFSQELTYHAVITLSIFLYLLIPPLFQKVKVSLCKLNKTLNIYKIEVANKNERESDEKEATQIQK